AFSSFFHRYRKLAAVAALIVGAAISGALWMQHSPAPTDSQVSQVAALTEVVNDGSSVREVVLSDGSMVKLQPHSKLKFNDVKHATSRIVTLEGEAYFEVAHDKQRPFFVHAGRTLTKVLGTSFTIEAPGASKSVSVTVRTGTVSVSKESTHSTDVDTSTQVILTPNQRVVYDPVLDQLTASVVELPVLLPENVNREAMEFDDESVASILNKLETAYGVHISFDETALSKCRITTKFTTESLFNRLNVVAKAIGGSYRRDGTQILFTANGC
ncbi:MAG TPA: FecR domain-containing protein, partial [Chryseolinea sp.]|nr:FecR domain-containing protein [Chryseolinea sp.]